MKKCFNCGESFPIKFFYKHPGMRDGYVNKCKECSKKGLKINYLLNKEYYHKFDKHRQRYSRKRIFNHRYNQLVKRSKNKSTINPIFGDQVLTYSEYCVWLKDNMDIFEALYRDWEGSGFKRSLCPSIDRIDNKSSYTPDNMQWLTVSKNSSKYTK